MHQLLDVTGLDKLHLRIGIIPTMFSLLGPCRAGEGSAQPVTDLTKGEELTRRK